MPLPDDEEKWMSARAFARGLSDALDEVQFDGRTIKISRHGRLAATLIPPQSAGDDAPPRIDAEPEQPDVELTELEGLVVDAVARHPHRWWVGYWLTPAGRRLARARGAPSE